MQLSLCSLSGDVAPDEVVIVDNFQFSQLTSASGSMLGRAWPPESADDAEGTMETTPNSLLSHFHFLQVDWQS